MSEQYFTWLNEPASHSTPGSQRSVKDYQIAQVEARSKPATDFWRKPPSVHRDTGHFYYTTVEGEFHISCIFKGEWKTRYDQAGLMCRLNSQKWIKAGIEYDEDKTFASAVVTNPNSDWSLAEVELTSEKDHMYIEMQRKAGNIYIRYGLVGENEDLSKGPSTTPLRTVNGFMGPDANESIQVGIMLCSPKSQDGVQVNFKNIIINKISQ
ncbi:hypothetical protein NQZ79_g3325 [Umbelopsis isabellina]|nr:hypothetical protein NQZ79_g3325 [Umbelopsis isabellina]